ncbi:YhbD family protein [Paenibacillus koleovorans]|uniref:YhbD family protein n=1 Tax=Paenibacillus koleovorans TaxID=121608 RepID=UPI000FDC4A7E|nr:YhbD family protein [Paenibacillus koleovorans]
MDPNLISKKELLEQCGISYGQLYRWKRKQLIPEEWFIRKSTFTGQETFFPKHLILERIDKIINLKEDLSLDQLADKLSPVLLDMEMRKHELMDRNIVSRVVMDRYAAETSGETVFSFEMILTLYTVDQLLQTGEMSLEEGTALVQTMREHLQKFEGKPCDLLFVRKIGVSWFALVSGSADVFMESGAKLVMRDSLGARVEKLKELLV